MNINKLDKYLIEGKNVSAIKKKAEQLKKKLNGKAVKENFGDKEERQLNDFIGDIWSYGMSERQQIMKITGDFFNWRTSYTG